MFREKTILLFKSLLLIALSLLGAQQVFEFSNVKELNGVYEKSGIPQISIDNWFSGSFQNQFEAYSNENFGFRPSFVRFRNQTIFSLFEQSPHTNVQVYNGDNFFFKDNISEYLGSEAKPSEEIEERCQRIKKLEIYLRERGKGFVMAIAPDKASYFSSEIGLKPYLEIDSSNYAKWIRSLERNNISYIDFRKQFYQAKDSSPYPLFPNYGVHWSVYGMRNAMDSIAGFMNTIYGFDLPRMEVNNVELGNYNIHSENDIEGLLNLIYPLKKERLAYQNFSMSTGKRKKILVVSDSFFNEPYHSGFSNRYFETQYFFRYHAKALKFGDFNFNQDPKSHDLEWLLNEVDMVLIMPTVNNLSSFPWSFSARFRNQILNKVP
jgi:hypothetical protein